MGDFKRSYDLLDAIKTKINDCDNVMDVWSITFELDPKYKDIVMSITFFNMKGCLKGWKMAFPEEILNSFKDDSSIIDLIVYDFEKACKEKED